MHDSASSKVADQKHPKTKRQRQRHVGTHRDTHTDVDKEIIWLEYGTVNSSSVHHARKLY